MAITLLYGCGQIETTVRDLQAARSFMQDVLGAGQIEQQMAREITDLFPPGEYTLEHFDCGEALFQVNAPSKQAKFDGHATLHQTRLERFGSCVTNLNYYVDDAVHAHGLLTDFGAPTYIEGPSNIIPCLADYGPENTRDAGDTRKFYFIGSRDLIGLDLEIMEPNFKRFTKQTVQYPCFVHPRPRAGEGNLKLLRVRLVVGDLAQTYGNLVKLIAPASRSKAYDIRQGALAKAFRIGLGGLELEYRQPVSRSGGLADLLARYGAGVVGIDFAARDLDGVLDKARGSANVEPEGDLLGLGRPPAPAEERYRIGSRDLVGFDVVVERLDERPLA